MSDSVHDLSIERRMAAPPEAVWRAWTEHLTEWFAPSPWKTVKAELDLRPGGRFVLFVNHPLFQTPGSGWIDDQVLDPPEQYWRVGPYLSEAMTIEEVDAGVRLPFFHRPLSRYVNAMAARGLYLTRMVEPAPPSRFLALAPQYEDAASIPRLLLLRAEKR